VKIPADAAIPTEKLTRYLLVRRPWDDKSRFLARAGFMQGNPDELLADLRRHAARFEAVPDGQNEYGEFFRVDGELPGPSGVELCVATIWMRWNKDGSWHFITLKPAREKRS